MNNPFGTMWTRVRRLFSGPNFVQEPSRSRPRRLGVETLEDRVVPAFSLSVVNPVVQ